MKKTEKKPLKSKESPEEKKARNYEYYHKNKDKINEKVRLKRVEKLLAEGKEVRVYKKHSTNASRKETAKRLLKKWKGDKTQLTIYVKSELGDVFKKYCQEKGVRMTRLIDDIYEGKFNSDDFLKYIEENNF
jgi:hypothetical protein